METVMGRRRRRPRGTNGASGKARTEAKAGEGANGGAKLDADALIEELLGFLDAEMLLRGRFPLSAAPAAPARTRKRTMGYYE